VTFAGWQVILCDPMWHVSSRSSEATLRTAIHLLLTYSFCYPRDAMLARAWASAHRGKWGQLTPSPGKMDEKLKSENTQKKSSFLRIYLESNQGRQV